MSRLACGGMVEAAVAERRGAVDSGDDDDRDQGKHVRIDTPELFIITFIFTTWFTLLIPISIWLTNCSAQFPIES